MWTWSCARLTGLLTTLCGLLTLIDSNSVLNCYQPFNNNSTIYDFSVTKIDGNKVVNLEEFRGQVLLIVNVATY
ncbi:glutathione peroxidase-like isoform X1 [Biomphalaria pfeifferi]|uniref:Glutathione peroxidase-like isoform X1 n=1 Tax=Biomphalaria pfeifferi TaxID=112525 RepID=A0AAD8AXG6_BIOPF|nr:glutathione peroxidase-like isoform X1 [Biomphalaria pfeifferi]